MDNKRSGKDRRQCEGCVKDSVPGLLSSVQEMAKTVNKMSGAGPLYKTLIVIMVTAMIGASGLSYWTAAGQAKTHAEYAVDIAKLEAKVKPLEELMPMVIMVMRDNAVLQVKFNDSVEKQNLVNDGLLTKLGKVEAENVEQTTQAQEQTKLIRQLVDGLTSRR